MDSIDKMLEQSLVFKSTAEFMVEIEALVKEKRVSYIDAVVLYCDLNQIEIETAAFFFINSQVLY